MGNIALGNFFVADKEISVHFPQSIILLRQTHTIYPAQYLSLLAASYTQCSIIYILSRISSSSTWRRQIHALNGQCDGHVCIFFLFLFERRFLFIYLFIFKDDYRD